MPKKQKLENKGHYVGNLAGKIQEKGKIARQWN